jgi:hypothetical protein
MIAMKCPHCMKKMKVPDSHAGGWEKCPACGRDIPVEDIPLDDIPLEPFPEFTRVRPAGAVEIEIICPNAQCGYKGPAWLKSDCDNSLGCLLMFFFLLPGILYFIIRGGEGHKHCECPKCGIRVR